MLFLKLWNYLKGYVIISVEGFFIEKFINICIHREILLWNIDKKSDKLANIKISIEGFKLIRPIRRKAHCKVKIVKKVGMPFLLSKYKHRKVFYLGIAAFCTLFFILTMFIWDIDIEGNKEIPSENILSQLKALGVKPGMMKHKIDTDSISDNMMINSNDFVWMCVAIRGSKLKVKVAERGSAPQLVPKDMPCDIVAKKNGVIELIVAKTGETLVKNGDAVNEGQVLISSKVNIKDQEPHIVHAIGTVEARTWYEKIMPVEFKRVEKHRTGQVKTRLGINICTKDVTIYRQKNTFKNYDLEEQKKKIFDFNDFMLPLQITMSKFYEVNIEEKQLQDEEAKEKAAEKVYSDVVKKIPAEAKIINRQFKYSQGEDGVLQAHVIVECVEQIGIEKEQS